MKASLEHINPDLKALSSLATYWRIEPVLPFHRHAHEEYELIYFEAGCGTLLVGDTLRPYGPGDLILIGANTPHSVFGQERKDGVHKALVIQFSRELFATQLRELPEMRFAENLLRKSRQGVLFSRRTAQQMRSKLIKLNKSEGLERLGRLLMVLDKLGRSRGACVIASTDWPTEVSQRNEKRIDRVCRFLHQNLHRSLRRPEVARQAKLSASAFSRFFKRTVGVSYSRFLLRLRLSRACVLLRETDLSPRQIAGQCGFDSLAQFRRNFRDAWALSPSQYRTRLALASHG
jgi:AraC-like DNA-binding protein/quercetin dioxygenase-like cupin family protein